MSEIYHLKTYRSVLPSDTPTDSPLEIMDRLITRMSDIHMTLIPRQGDILTIRGIHWKVVLVEHIIGDFEETKLYLEAL